MNVYWQIVAVALQDRLEHDHWCSFPNWKFLPLDIVCDCNHAAAIRAVAEDPTRKATT